MCSSDLVAYRTANLKTGVVGIKVSIMPAGTVLPDKVELVQEAEPKVEELSEKDIPKSETEIIQKVEEDEEKASGKIKKTVKQDVKEESKKKEKKPAKNQSNKKPEEKGKEK